MVCFRKSVSMSYWPSLFLVRGYVERVALSYLPSLNTIPKLDFIIEFEENKDAEVWVSIRHKLKTQTNYRCQIDICIRWATYKEDCLIMEEYIQKERQVWWNRYTK